MKTLSLKLNVKIPTANVECVILSDRSIGKKECSHIGNEIYLSGYTYGIDYEYLKTNNFTHIINCAAGSRRFKSVFYDEFKYLVLDILDDLSVEIDQAIKSVIEFIEKANTENSNRKILIHCFEGISRAPTLLTSYLMWKYNLEKDNAISLIKEKRACIDINLGFMCQLDKIRNKFILAEE